MTSTAPAAHSQDRYDVLVVGEPLIEIADRAPLASGSTPTLDFSGDALNVACAAAGAGARTALVARIPDDRIGDAIIGKLQRFGVDTGHIIRGPGQHGVYFSHADPTGEREFVYVRHGSFGSTLQPGDVDPDLIDRSTVVTASGIAVAISPSAHALVVEIAARAETFVYDPNFRSRLTSRDEAAAALRQLLPHCAVVTPSWPGEVRALLDPPADAAESGAIARLRELGARDIVLTRGSCGSLVATGDRLTQIPVVPAPRVVDQTGAGDCMTGTLCARLAAGDDLIDAVRLGTAAASIAVGAVGGTGDVPNLERIRRHADSVLLSA